MLTKRLKDENWALHQIAERQESPGSMIKGTMPKEGYLNMLGQQYLVNAVFDEALNKAIADQPKIKAFVLDEQMLTQYIIEDMNHFGIDPASLQATPGTQRALDHANAHADNPLHLLGLHYVRLGACNGNSFVARVVRKVYNLDHPTEGTRYLDPFGADQRKKWMAFKDSLDSAGFNESEQDKIFAGTRAAYVNAINLDLTEFKSDVQLLEEHGKTLDRKAFDDGHTVHTEEIKKTEPVA